MRKKIAFQSSDVQLVDKDGIFTALYKCFLYTNKELEAIEFVGFNNLKSIEELCLGQCKNLKSVKLSGAPKLEVIGPSFLQGTAITGLDLDECPVLRTIGFAFLHQCNALESLRLKLPKLESIGGSFLGYCQNNLTKVEIDAPNLESIGESFLIQGNKVQTVTLKAPKLKTIGKLFLANTHNLESADFDFPALKAIPESFIHDSGIKSLKLRVSTELPISDFFLAYCPTLATVDLEGIKATSIGIHFLVGNTKVDAADLSKKLSSWK